MCAIYDESNWQDLKKNELPKKTTSRLFNLFFGSTHHINAFALYKIKTTAQKQKHAETNERYDHPRLRRAGGRGIRSFHGRCEVRYSLRGLILKSQTRKISSFCSLSRSRVSSSLLLNILTVENHSFSHASLEMDSLRVADRFYPVFTSKQHVADRENRPQWYAFQTSSFFLFDFSQKSSFWRVFFFIKRELS